MGTRTGQRRCASEARRDSGRAASGSKQLAAQARQGSRRRHRSARQQDLYGNCRPRRRSGHMLPLPNRVIQHRAATISRLLHLRLLDHLAGYGNALAPRGPGRPLGDFTKRRGHILRPYSFRLGNERAYCQFAAAHDQDNAKAHHRERQQDGDPHDCPTHTAQCVRQDAVTAEPQPATPRPHHRPCRRNSRLPAAQPSMRQP